MRATMHMGAVQPCVPGWGVHLDKPYRADDKRDSQDDRAEEGPGKRQPPAPPAPHLLGLPHVAVIGCRRSLEGAAATAPATLCEQANRLRSVRS